MTCDTILLLIFKFFMSDLLIIQAKPINLAFAFLIKFTHSKLDFPVVITSSIISTLEFFFIKNPLLNLNLPETLSQKILSFLIIYQFHNQ